MTRRPPISPLFPSTPLFRSIIPFLKFKETASSRLEAFVLDDPLLQRMMMTVIVNPEKISGINVAGAVALQRSEEHTSELQSQSNLVCRLLLEKKKRNLILHECSPLQPVPDTIHPSRLPLLVILYFRHKPS